MKPTPADCSSERSGVDPLLIRRRANYHRARDEPWMLRCHSCSEATNESGSRVISDFLRKGGYERFEP